MTNTMQADFPAAKRIAVWSGFQRGRQYNRLRFIVLDALPSSDGDIITKVQDSGHAYHYYITEDGQIFQQVLEEDTAVTNAVGERPEQFWFFASQHGQVDILSVHVCLVISSTITRELLQTLANLLADLHRRHRLDLAPASNNGGVALRSSLDISRDMRGFTPEILKDVLSAAQGQARALESYPTLAMLRKADEEQVKADGHDDESEKPKRGRPAKKDESKEDEKASAE